jgi:hypothetical protein
MAQFYLGMESRAFANVRAGNMFSYLLLLMVSEDENLHFLFMRVRLGLRGSRRQSTMHFISTRALQSASISLSLW